MKIVWEQILFYVFTLSKFNYKPNFLMDTIYEGFCVKLCNANYSIKTTNNLYNWTFEYKSIFYSPLNGDGQQWFWAEHAILDKFII